MELARNLNLNLNDVKQLTGNNLVGIEDNIKPVGLEDNFKAAGVEDNFKQVGEDNVRKLIDDNNFSGVEDNIKKLDDDSLKNYTTTIINNSGTGNIIFKKNNTKYDYNDYPTDDSVNFAIDYKITKTKIILNVMLLIGLFINF
jgi:hypothetical protein